MLIQRYVTYLLLSNTRVSSDNAISRSLAQCVYILIVLIMKRFRSEQNYTARVSPAFATRMQQHYKQYPTIAFTQRRIPINPIESTYIVFGGRARHCRVGENRFKILSSIISVHSHRPKQIRLICYFGRMKTQRPRI